VPQNKQIFVGDNRDGSSDYTIPGSAEIRVLAVNANFEDNGAGADWCPAVVMFSDSGSVIARALLPDVKVTAGDDAEVSWFPGVKPGGAATPASSAVAVAFGDGGPQTTPAGTNAWASFGSVSVSDPSVFSWTTTTNPNDTLVVAPAGVLLCVGSALTNVDTANQNVYVDSAQAGIFRHSAWPTPQVGDGTAPPEGFSTLMDQCWVNLSANDTHVHFAFSNGSGFDNGPTEIQLAALMFVGAEA
jgi:hypothetical protein